MNVLVIAPHPDDEAIGCGGSIRLHADAGDRVAVVYLTSGELGLSEMPREEAWSIREAEAVNAANVLGISRMEFLRMEDWSVGDNLDAAASALAAVLRTERPQRIYLPHVDEWHPDHKAAAPTVERALELAECERPELFGYEVWTPIVEIEQVTDISVVMRTKLRAVRCHKSQLREYRYDRAIHGLNAYRGVISGKCRYAEVFAEVAFNRPMDQQPWSDG